MTYNFGLCAQYNPLYPMVSTDLCYKKHNWQFYLSFMKNWHHMAAMNGQDFELKGVNFDLHRTWFILKMRTMNLTWN